MNLTNATYEKLTPDQRFRATIEAMSRFDLDEIDRLQETCVRRQVSTQEPAYFERLRYFQSLVLHHGIVLFKEIVKWTLAFYQLHECGMPSDSAAEMSPEAEKRANALSESIARIKAYSVAWDAFCNELAIDPSTTYYGPLEGLDEYAKTCVGAFDMVEPDEEIQQEWSRFLSNSWRERLFGLRSVDKVSREQK